ncbi:hypothetical protein [Candidatus Erwinia haradaeae]|uniref:hypothetical protein n=1 Tax=Candidatus Erwinia haradaeae TaxID=1922217 RepID=UPI001300228C|nr:hypothetical protein [Candidatus Erwinia haradaeae]
MLSLLIGGTQTVSAAGTEPSALNHATDDTTHITTPTPDPPAYSSIFSIVLNGKVAGGQSYRNEDEMRATIWSGQNWGTAKILPLPTPTADDDYSSFSLVHSLSADGTIAGGYAPVETDVRHAVIWSGPNWGKVTNLEHWTPEHTSVSVVNSLSADGKIAGGSSTLNRYQKNHATIWSGENWGTKTDIGIIGAKQPVSSEVLTLSADGKVAGGDFSVATHDQHGVIWSGENWQTQTHVDDSSGKEAMFFQSSEVNVISGDGKVAGGYYAGEDRNPHATIWYGDKWEHKVNLDESSKSGAISSKIYALSNDGKLAAGSSSHIPEKDFAGHPTIWYGEKWSHWLDVGALEPDFAGRSDILAFSPDGKMAIGVSMGKSVHKRPFFIYLPKYITDLSADGSSAESAASQEATSSVDSSSRSKPSMFDLSDAISTMNQVAIDTFSLMTAQQRALTNLQQGCIANSKNMCWLIHVNPATFVDKDVLPVVNVGYGLTEAFSFGGVVTRFLPSSLPKSHKINGNNLGVGLYADWHALQKFGDFYLRPAVSFNQSKIDIKRAALLHTAAGEGNTEFNGLSSSLEWGGGHSILSKNIACFWHTSIGYNAISRDAYLEARTMNFPVVSYRKINYSNIRGDAGADIRISILKPVILVSGVKIEHMLQWNSFLSKADISGQFLNNSYGNIPPMIRILKTGVIYTFNNNLSLSVFKTMTKNNEGFKSWKWLASVAGTF